MPILLQKINIQITLVLLFFQNFWSYRSIRNSQVATDCSILTDSVLFVLCAYFDGSMVFFDEFLPQKSWNTVDIIQKQNMNWFDTSLIVVVCFLILTDLMKVLLSFVWLKFSSFGWYYDGWNNKDSWKDKLGDAQGTPCGTPAWRYRNAPYSIPEIKMKSSGIRHFLI